MKELNAMRLLAGIPIDGSIEITEKAPVTESVQLTEAARDSAIKDFWCVKGVSRPDTKLSDCLRGTNTQGLCHMIRDASDAECDELLIFAGGDKVAASKEAKKRIKAAQNQAVEAEEEAFFKQAEADYEEECEMSEYEEEQEWGAATPQEQAQAAQARPPIAEPQAAQDANAARAMSEAKDKPDFLDVDKDGDKKESMKKAEKDKKKETNESMHTFKVNNYDSFEDDEEDAVNVVDGNGKKTAAFKDVDTVDAEPNSTDVDRANDKDESPCQLHALDTPSPQDQSGGGDMERKLPCPAKIKNLLKAEAKQAREEGEKLSVTDREASYFYDDLANAFEDLYNHLDGGTVYDVKKAQIFMTSLMGPMLHKIPADVVNWIAKGGQQRSLKSYMQPVDAKYPITGPRNAL